MRGGTLRFLKLNTLRMASQDAVRMEARRGGVRSLGRQGPTGGRGIGTGGLWGSHAVTDGMSRSRDVAFRASVSSTVEFIVAPSMAMKASGPVMYVRVQERLIVLRHGEVRGQGRTRVVRDL